MGVPQASDQSKTASSRSGAGADAEAVRRSPPTNRRALHIFPTRGQIRKEYLDQMYINWLEWKRREVLPI